MTQKGWYAVNQNNQLTNLFDSGNYNNIVRKILFI